MKTSDRVNFMNSLEIAQARTLDTQLADKLVLALIHEGFCFSRPAPSWGIATVPNHEPRVQVEFDGNNVHFIQLGPVEGRNSFPLEPDVSLPFNTEDDIQQALNAFRILFYSMLNSQS
jgi:hypothetical protein